MYLMNIFVPGMLYYGPVVRQVLSWADVRRPSAPCGSGGHKFVVNDGFVFRANKLCFPASSVRLLLLQEAHGGGLMGHFGVKKTEDILATHSFWGKMRRDV